VESVRFLPGEQHLSGRTGEHRQRGADRDGVAQAHRSLGGGHTDAMVALAAEELGGLIGVIAQCAQHGPAAASRRSSPAAAANSPRRGTEDEAALQVAGHQAVVFEGHGQPVGRGPGQAGAVTSCASVEGPASRAPSTMAALSRTPTPLTDLVHVLILPSRLLRRKSILSRTRCEGTVVEGVRSAAVAFDRVERGTASMAKTSGREGVGGPRRPTGRG
jgi:hypothetical protein